MEDQIDIKIPKDLTVKLQGLPIILKKGTKVFCRQSNFDFAMKEYEEWEKTKDIQNVSSPVELQVSQKTPDAIEIPELSIKEVDIIEIMTNALSEMERKIYMILLKNNLKFEYTEDEFKQINFDEYMLEENYDPERNINIIDMVKR